LPATALSDCIVTRHVPCGGCCSADADAVFFVGKQQENRMKTNHQPSTASQAQDAQVQALTAQEVQQVSGGYGQNRSFGVVVPQRSVPGQGSVTPTSGKTFFTR